MEKSKAEDDIDADHHGTLKPMRFSIVSESAGHASGDNNSSYFVNRKV
jgi:hypothetical protein